MTDLIEQGAHWLTGQRRERLSREIEYQSGPTSTVIPASIGRTEFEVVNEHGIAQRTESRDFIVAVADFPGSAAGELPGPGPARGDRIRETNAPFVHVYEVMAPVQSEPPWRWADAARTAYRIHTRLVGVEPTHAFPSGAEIET